ncbi:MAG: type II CRISPR-associated endonuclease Cas1 [Magnetospirillum sp. WYHS-4]
MAWRGVVLTRPAALSLDGGCCLVDSEDGAIRLAFEDISYLVLDTQRVSLTGALLARFAEEKVLLVACDGSHLPTGALLPLQGHHRQTESLRLQLAAPEGLKGKLWQRLIRAKILNQGRVLEAVKGDGAGRAFRAMAERVQPGDPDNVEARAARDHFGGLFDDFRRQPQDGDPRNSMLNYAYAILRAGIARGLAAQGFHPALGIHHDGVGNAFNLADDLIEPWRPLADLHVVRHLERRADEGEDLTVADRRELARLLVAEARFGDETTSVVTGIERMADGLAAAFRRKNPALLPLPEPVVP